ncbi:P97 family adhesin [Mesomycoplasma ovipneumoniae]|uniref:P97 family adhesin n=1 Tax=Mesomycoplasma ovipneumoniae TaxID=29562 RepID=UPI003080C330
MKIVKKFSKTKFLTKKSKILLGLTLSASFLGVLGISVGISYGFGLIKKNSYQTTVEDLNRTITKINALSFNAQKVSPFSTYASLKDEWKKIQDSTDQGDFFDLFSLENKRLQPYKLPNGIWLEFVDVKPDDANQQFNVEFLLKTHNHSRIIKSDIRTDKISISPNSTFFLENFYQALQINLQNIRPFSRSEQNKVSPNIWLASDFLAEANSEQSAESFIKKVHDFFDFDFQSILTNKNFAIKHKNKLIFPYKIEIIKNNKNTWVQPSQLNSDFLEIQGKISFTEEAKEVFPKNFNTNITKNFTFLLFDSAKNKSAFIDPKVFIQIPKLTDLKVDQFSQQNQDNKVDISQKSISWVYNFLKYNETTKALKTSEEAKIALNSFINSDLQLDFTDYDDLDPKIKQKFGFNIIVEKIQLDSDEQSSLVRIPFEIFYPLNDDGSEKLTKSSELVLRNFKNSESQNVSTFDPKNFSQIPVVNLDYLIDKNKKDETFSSFDYVSKAEIQKLIDSNAHEEIYNILINSSKFNLNFPETQILNSWTFKYDFPTISEFSKRTLTPQILENSTNTRAFFENNQEFIYFVKNIFTLPKEEAQKYLRILFNSLAEIKSDTLDDQQKTSGAQSLDSTPKNETVAAQATQFQQTEAGNTENNTDSQGSQASQPAENQENQQQNSESQTPNTNLAPKIQTINEKIVSNLQNQYLITEFSDLITKIEALNQKNGQPQTDLNAQTFSDLFLETYKNNSLVKQFETLGENLSYKIVFLADQNSEQIDSEGQNSTPNPVQVADQQTSENDTTPQKEIFNLGYYYIFTSATNNKIVFRTPINSLKLDVFTDQNPQSEIEVLSNVVLNFPQNLLKLELDESNFATALTFSKTAEEVLHSEFNNKDKDFKETLESIKKLFGFSTFVQIYPLLNGHGLVYKKDSVFKDKFGNLKIRFAVKNLNSTEKSQIFIPNTVNNEQNNPDNSVQNPSAPQDSQPAPTPPAQTPPAPTVPAQPVQPQPQPQPQPQTQQPTTQNSQPQLKNNLDPFVPGENEAKYPLIFTVIRPKRQLNRN